MEALKTHKFMQTVTKRDMRVLEAEARRRSMSVQNLIRFVVLPEWMSKHDILAKAKTEA